MQRTPLQEARPPQRLVLETTSLEIMLLKARTDPLIYIIYGPASGG